MSQLTTPQPQRCASPTVKAQQLAYLIFERPDLAQAERFLCDFGLSVAHRSPDTLYLRAADTSPYCYRIHLADKARFVGLALRVACMEDLQALARLPGASPIEPSLALGGGQFVRLTDPSGFIVEAICGQSSIEPLSTRLPLVVNQGVMPPPRINAWQRPPETAPQILKLGHVVMEVADFQATCAWYTQHFGFIPSDVQVLPDGSPVVVFMRLNLGDLPADHHTMALAQGFMPTYSHSAYEVVDTDAVGMGQRVLRERGWRHAWGMGRHILGSQIFDYWQDPWGDKHEHYSDGDVLTANYKTGFHPVSRDAMSQWGPPMPRSFTKPKLSPANLMALLRNLRRSPDLNIRKLMALAKLFG